MKNAMANDRKIESTNMEDINKGEKNEWKLKKARQTFEKKKV